MILFYNSMCLSNLKYNSLLESNHNCVRKGKNLSMKLNLFNTVNNKECRRGQRSVVWLKCGQPGLHHLYVLSTTFSWWPLSLFSFGIILLPHPPPPPPPTRVCKFYWWVESLWLLLHKFWSQFWRKIRQIWRICEPCPPFIFPLINQCDRCLVPLAWGFMAGGHGFASHGDITLSRGWLCRKWKPLDILGTHLH